MSNPKPSATLLKAIAVTSELTGRVFSPEAAAVFAADLAKYPEHQVLSALTRCRLEVKGSRGIVQEDVISRLDDGRPGPDEAWAMLPFDEAASTVWTEEMAASWGIAQPLLAVGDKVGARMAFKESYIAAVSRARTEARPPRWTPSLGHDVNGREAALTLAVDKGRITQEHAARLLPNLQGTPQFERLLLEQPGTVVQPMVKRLPIKTRAFAEESEEKRRAEAEIAAREAS